jgi:hypothetical protein
MPDPFLIRFQTAASPYHPTTREIASADFLKHRQRRSIWPGSEEIGISFHFGALQEQHCATADDWREP